MADITWDRESMPESSKSAERESPRKGYSRSVFEGVLYLNVPISYSPIAAPRRILELEYVAYPKGLPCGGVLYDEWVLIHQEARVQRACSEVIDAFHFPPSGC
jgi:hypothetical protein